MALQKYARFEVLSAHLAPNRLARTAARDVVFNRTAHRFAFKYDPKPGFLYVRSRAISSRCNDNFDDFPADEIKQAYATFIGKPVFVNHNNANHRRMRGVCIDAALHEDANPDGTPDTWVEVLMEIDAVKFPKLAQAILAGHIDRTSMGTDVAYSLCSFCGNKASTPLEYCNHIPKLKGKRIRRVMANGEKQDVLVKEICHGLRFFENSVLVEPPADPTAYFLGVEAGPGVQVSATLHGVVASDDPWAPPPKGQQPDTDHQRANWVTWKHVKPGDRVSPPRHGVYGDERMARRINHPFGTYLGKRPHPDHRGEVTPAHVVQFDDGSIKGYPTGPRKILHIPQEQKESTLSRAAALITEALWTEGGWEETGPGRQEWVGPREDLGVLKGKALIDHMQERHGYVTWKPPRPNTRDYKTWQRQHDEDNHGRWADQSDHTHGPAKESALSRAAALIEQAMQVEAEKGNNLTIDFFGIQQTCTSEQASLVLDFLMAARQAGYTHQPKTDNGFEDTWVVQFPWTPEEVGGESMAQARRDFLVEKGIPAKFMKVSSRHHAIGEVVAPAKVDTLRDEICPVCGEADSYDGDKCLVCGYVKPPDEFMDPDLDKARNTDLRQEQDDNLDLGGGAGDLTCENCGQDYLAAEMAETDPLGDDTNTGDEFNDAESDPREVKTDDDNAAKPDADWTTDPAKLPHLPKPKKPDQEDAAQPDKGDPKLPKSKDMATKQKAGDTCPNCGQGTLKPKGKGDGDAFVPPTKGAPQDGAEDEDSSEDADDKDGKGKKKPPWMKDKKSSALSRAAILVRRCEADEQKEKSMRPALAALQEQQKVITAQEGTINKLRGAVAFIAEAAGLSGHPQIAAVLEDPSLQTTADVNNPAQPLPDPPSQGPVETTEQALAPAGRDDPESIGASPVAGTAPAATTSLDEVGGTVANDPLDLNEEDVTAPVAGTEGPRPLSEVKTEVEQRIGPWQGNDPNPAFPLQGPFAERARTGSVTEGRTIACLRLARLRMQAGIAAEATDDLSLGTEIAQGDMSDEMVQAEIDTLGKVMSQSAKRQPVARNLVPQAAPPAAPTPVTAAVQRTVPSMASPAPAPRTEAPGPIQASASLMAPDDAEFMFE